MEIIPPLTAVSCDTGLKIIEVDDKDSLACPFRNGEWMCCKIDQKECPTNDDDFNYIIPDHCPLICGAFLVSVFG